MADKSGSDKKKSPGGRLRSLADRAKEVEDPAWRNWFLDVDRKRRESEKKKFRLVVSTFEKDGQECRIARSKSQPTPVKQFIKVGKKKTAASKITDDLIWIRKAWPDVVGNEIAGETEVYAFKAGVLTISVFSSVLLQEIRQFFAESLLNDMRESWKASIPLLKITYRLGRR